MHIETDTNEGRDSEDCRQAGLQVLADPQLWAVVAILLTALAMLG